MAQQIIPTGEFMNPHTVLHENISMLLTFHPAPDAFNNAFKKNMFILPNKKGFYEVTNYINTIIDKEKWQSIIDWPVINNKDEMKFRRAVVKFIADLNSLYDAYVIPILNPSVLMSPGGPSVARFILKLSEYAIRKFMKDEFGFENTLGCLKFKTRTQVKLKLETVSLTNNVHCLKKLETEKKNHNHALQKKKYIQEQLLKIRETNDDIEREILQIAPQNNSKEHVEQWNSELNNRLKERQGCVDYLAGIETSVNRCQLAANRALGKDDASILVLDGSKIMKSLTENDETSPIDLASFFKSSAAAAATLALRLKSSKSTQDNSELTAAAMRIRTETSIESAILEVLEKDLLNSITKSKKAINELEPIVLSAIIDEEKVPLEIRNYTASPVWSLVKKDARARRLQNVIPPRETSVLDWIKNNIFKETEKVRDNRNTPVKREHVSLLLKKGMISEKTIGLGEQLNQCRSRVQLKLQETPKRNTFGSVQRINLQETMAGTSKPQSVDKEDSIVLPHNLSVSTASPCNKSTCSTPNDLCWQPAGPVRSGSSVDRLSTAVSSITSPNIWAEEIEDNFLSSTPYFINNNSISSLPADHHSQDLCRSSPSRVVHLPADKSRKMRPSLENIIARYKAFKRNQHEKSDCDS